MGTTTDLSLFSTDSTKLLGQKIEGVNVPRAHGTEVTAVECRDLAKVPLSGRPFRAENGAVAAR
jgi:hypothetical protein